MNKRTRTIAMILTGSILVACGGAENTDSNTTTTDSVQTEAVIEEVVEEEETAEISFNWVITSEGAGDFTPGDQVPQPSDAFTIEREMRSFWAEGDEYVVPISKVMVDGEVVVELHGDSDAREDDPIMELFVLSEQFKTEKGIGVGSTIEEFIEAYPDYSLWYTYISGRHIIETDEVAAQFIINEEDVAGEIDFDSDMTILTPENFKAGAKIQTVRMY